MLEKASRVAVDIGGTFTDLVSYSESSGLRYSKSLTTYDALARGVFACIGLAEIALGDVATLVHGSTIAINTVIQRTGARAGLITTKGFGDVYAIGRSNRPDAYNLAFEKAVPLISRDMIFEVDERMRANGEILRPLRRDSVEEAVRRLIALKVDAIAVVLLHAYRNPAHELAVRKIIEAAAPGVYISLSHEILREFREYERTSTTVLNAYIGPVVANYVKNLSDDMRSASFRGSFRIMQSNGGAISAEAAAIRPVTLMESGPVAGVIGCAKLARDLGLANAISFDMGGTTAKTSLVENGETRIVAGYHIGGLDTGHPMMLPVVDIVEIGAGGGSIAWIDAGGGLKVGPISAGSSPGPVCYGAGGERPTITDANLALGRLDPLNFLGGQMALDADAARRAIKRTIADPFGMSVEGAALGVVKIADAKMSLAVREVSVAKGFDPREFALIATGGAGPLHAASIARELSIPTVIVPELPGAFSALGMLACDLRHDYVRTMILDLRTIDAAQVDAVFDEMTAQADASLARDGAAPRDRRFIRSFDMRYQGQEYTLTTALRAGSVDVEALQAARCAFDALHQAQYGHSAPQEPVEIVNLRLAAVGMAGDARPFRTKEIDARLRTGAPKGRRIVFFDKGAIECPVFDRHALAPEKEISGPAIIEEQSSTTIVHPGDRAKLLETGPIMIAIGAD